MMTRSCQNTCQFYICLAITSGLTFAVEDTYDDLGSLLRRLKIPDSHYKPNRDHPNVDKPHNLDVARAMAGSHVKDEDTGIYPALRDEGKELHNEPQLNKRVPPEEWICDFCDTDAGGRVSLDPPGRTNNPHYVTVTPQGAATETTPKPPRPPKCPKVPPGMTPVIKKLLRKLLKKLGYLS